MNTSLIRSLTAVALLQTACLEVQEKPVDYGPEVSLDEIYKALQEPLGSTNNVIGNGEKSELVAAAYLRSGESFLIQKENREVVSREDKTSYWIYNSKISRVEYADGKPVPKPEELDKTPVNKPKGIDVNSVSLLETQDLAPTKSTFHKLLSEDFVMEPPQKVKNKSGCVAIPDCKLRARKVSVVKVDWLPEGKKRHDLEFIVTPDAPYFSRLLQQCDTFLKDLGGRSIALTLCNSVTDFDFGTAW